MITFKDFITEVAQTKQNLGRLNNATSGGANGDWGGSLPKLISLLPMGNWNASSQKRSKINTASGYMSDHYQGNSTAYAADFGLNSTFNGSVAAATKFAIDVARNSGVSINSWDQFKEKKFENVTQDGYRVQVIWLSNVGGNHYDHVHVGVQQTVPGAVPSTSATPYTGTEQQDQGNSLPPPSDPISAALDQVTSGFQALTPKSQ